MLSVDLDDMGHRETLDTLSHIHTGKYEGGLVGAVNSGDTHHLDT